MSETVKCERCWGDGYATCQCGLDDDTPSLPVPEPSAAGEDVVGLMPEWARVLTALGETTRENERLRKALDDQGSDIFGESIEKMRAFLMARSMGPYGVPLTDALLENFVRIESELTTLTTAHARVVAAVEKVKGLAQLDYHEVYETTTEHDWDKRRYMKAADVLAALALDAPENPRKI